MPDSGSTKTTGRNLPSWVSSRENANRNDGKTAAGDGTDKENNERGTHDQAKRRGKAHTNQNHSQENEGKGQSSASNLSGTKFSKLLEGVVFVLSGFVNPERSVLRSQALEMGADYQADWNTNCTLLVCAFPNTPKFRQVEADCGTIVSKEWITECYNQKKLADIETYLMHAGKPWRKQSTSVGTSQDLELSATKKAQKQVEKAAHSKPTTSASSKTVAKNHGKDGISPSKVKKWAIDDMERTISWLGSQEEKPDPSETKKIAAEGILTCLQDAIDSLRQNQDIGQIMEQWSFIPRVVEELRMLETAGDASASHLKDLYQQAMAWKQIYEVELGKLDDDSAREKKKLKTEERDRGGNERAAFPVNDAAACDSDDTIEMTEDEIGQAYNSVASSFENAR